MLFFFHCAYANTQIALSCYEVDEFSEIPFPPLSGNFSSYEIQGWVLLSRHFAVAYTVGRERAGWAQALPSLLGFCHTRAHALKLWILDNASNSARFCPKNGCWVTTGEARYGIWFYSTISTQELIHLLKNSFS